MFPIETTILRQRTWPAFLIMAVAVGIGVIGINKNETTPLWIAIGVFVFSAVLYLLIRQTQITVDNFGITYKSLLSSKEVLWDRINKTYLKSEHHGKSSSKYWYFETSDGKKVKFSVDLLSRKSLRTIAEAITMKCKSADIEKRIYDMAEGQFPWYM